MGALRRLFGPSQEEIWRQLSDQIQGRYVERTWQGAKVEAQHGAWTVTLDSYTMTTGQTRHTYTRLRAPFANPGGFRFAVYRRGFFSDIARWLGMQDVQVGHEPFDRDFIIKGNSEAKLVELFANRRVRELIAAQPQIHFEIKDDDGWFGARFPEGTDQLHFNCAGLTKDVARLEQLYQLFAETLDQLCRMGVAVPTPVDVKLK